MNPTLICVFSILSVFASLGHAASAVATESTFPAVSGKITTTRTIGDETLMEVALRAGFGYEAVANSNRSLDPWKPGRGTEVILPGKALVPYGAKAGLTINLAELRLFHISALKDGYRVSIYPLGIGREGRETPEGQFRVIVKQEHPGWRVPEGLRVQEPGLPQVVPPGPHNPLGDYWLGLSAPGYGVHGTNRPLGVGRRVSYGCMRLYPQDIATLYRQIEPGTPVQISYQPIKAAMDGGKLLLEVHPDYQGRFDDPFQNALHVISKTGWQGDIDYSLVRGVVRAQQGLPQIIGRWRHE